MSNRQPSRVVFVGNIPYGKSSRSYYVFSKSIANKPLSAGLTEEQITEIFSGAGRVLNFRLVYDRETGRPKGFGFAEFPDHDSASSAVRNLNDYEIMGRKLRVDFSNETVSDEDGRDRDAAGPSAAGYSAPSNGNNVAAPVVPAGGSSLPPLPQGKDLPPGVSCTDAISQTLRTLPPAQLLDIIQQMKTLATNDPARCAELLNQAPQLGYAVFQALLIMGLVSPDAINSVLDTGASVAPPPAAVPANYGGYPVPAATSTPVGGYAAPPVAAPVVPVPGAAPPPVAAPPPAQDPEALMRAVMELPQETIDMLPEAEKQQILALRAQFSLQVTAGNDDNYTGSDQVTKLTAELILNIGKVGESQPAGGFDNSKLPNFDIHGKLKGGINRKFKNNDHDFDTANIRKSTTVDNGSDLGSHDFYSPTGGRVISEEDVDDLILEITPPAAPVALNTFIPGHNLLRSTPNNSKSPSINEKPSDYQD
ncbi:hypothetical protein QC764_106970 [Podospora pseudoanserina]|uniref:RRM domain-containing protein n=1 Tax=Podospora pseudoanserina TaxID=2609844 RepID=A0ABR0IMJ5_9PEZI|nr:hypothetical protein QC764_106970 [Podospora pseudoanserina]